MKILLPIDKSDCSDAAAHAVLTQFRPEQTEVRVMHCVEWPKNAPTYLAFAQGPTAARDFLEIYGTELEGGRYLVEEVARQLKAAGFQTSTDVREGSATQTILTSADEWHPDLIVIGSHGKKGAERFFLGSVAEYVMRHAACAVEVVRPAARESEQRPAA